MFFVRLDHQIESQSEQRRSSKEHPPITVTAVVNDSSPKESESKEKDASLHREREDVYERPKTLKFLAASAAFQSSTVPALKRLPYTPDPGKLLFSRIFFRFHDKSATIDILRKHSVNIDAIGCLWFVIVGARIVWKPSRKPLMEKHKKLRVYNLTVNHYNMLIMWKTRI